MLNTSAVVDLQNQQPALRQPIKDAHGAAARMILPAEHYYNRKNRLLPEETRAEEKVDITPLTAGYFDGKDGLKQMPASCSKVSHSLPQSGNHRIHRKPVAVC